MNTDRNIGNRIWIDGIEIDIVSGDVSALEAAIAKSQLDNDGIVRFEFPGGHYSILVSPNTSVISRYVH